MMAIAAVSEQEILAALHRVPTERWPSVLHLLQGLENSPAVETPILTAADLAKSDLVGMFADRDDIQDSRDFARQLRVAAATR